MARPPRVRAQGAAAGRGRRATAPLPGGFSLLHVFTDRVKVLSFAYKRSASLNKSATVSSYEGVKFCISKIRLVAQLGNRVEL